MVTHAQIQFSPDHRVASAPLDREHMNVFLLDRSLCQDCITDVIMSVM